MPVTPATVIPMINTVIECVNMLVWLYVVYKVSDVVNRLMSVYMPAAIHADQGQLNMERTMDSLERQLTLLETTQNTQTAAMVSMLDDYVHIWNRLHDQDALMADDEQRVYVQTLIDRSAALHSESTPRAEPRPQRQA